ncbi:MAG: mechanosensitive ion channel, partial [Gammaproteobacteria bacterium]|nr:mechanosensitive ion channel [Gemmatimonadota bacterium]NIR35936.1 mechanosensitive ion channel [Actinomycetota bacterium]NIU73794.1 mechanosensitive ion channel [Gammaproteobacteria bacterium]NIY08138.1 mechanosensitive ion channel [Gemmatimonadota bacterium]
ADPLVRAAVILALAVALHLLIRILKRAVGHALGPVGARRPPGARGRHPKLATVVGLALSTATFALWFAAIGLALAAFDVDLTAYFATATVIGLAVGFGSQGLVQDVVIGLTLIFTDALDVGDMVEVSGQVGRVERVGLRFTTLTNFLGQTVYIPNRNIAVVGRFRRGGIHAFVDAQVPEGTQPEVLADMLLGLARGLRAQHPAIVLDEPTLVGVQRADPGGWRYVRIRLRLWPGQQALVESAFRQRILAFMKGVDEGYADWMVTVTYRV